ncbi:MAG: hypothetical protein JW797_00550 [Bradymonadales bacterium]|nr:hypothetical protein [Bradymonadales bacterium]
MKRSPRRVLASGLALATAAIMALSAGGCLMTYDPDSVKLAVTSPCDPQERSLTMVAPTEGQQVTGEILEILVVVCGVTLVDHWEQPNVDGEGHLIAYVDGIYQSQRTAETHFGIDLEANHIEPGDHRLRVQLCNNDLSAITDIPPVEVNFTRVANGQ